MLSPYVLVACEKAILSKENVASLIALFTKIAINIPAGAEIPKDAATPKEWAIFSMWNTEPGDENKEYILCTQILYPDGTQFSDVPKNKIAVEANKKSVVIVQVQGFPVGQDGPYTIRTWIEKEQETVVGPLEFTMEVEIVRIEQLSK
jgi:hypothetical protein